MKRRITAVLVAILLLSVTVAGVPAQDPGFDDSQGIPQQIIAILLGIQADVSEINDRLARIEAELGTNQSNVTNVTNETNTTNATVIE